MNKKTVLGIDIGGTTITAGLVENNMLIKKIEMDTQAQASADVILGDIFKIIEAVWTDDIESIGMGVPGYLNVDLGTIELINNIPAFKGFCLKKPIQDKFNVPVFVNNDANCFALGEYYFGEAKKYKNVVGISLGTGLGGGIVINQKLHSGLYGGAGELGCLPYRDKNFEFYCSSNFFTKFHNKTGKELFNMAQAGDKQALLAFKAFGGHLGDLVNLVLYTFAPEAVIFGGSIAKSFKYFEAGLREKVAEFPVDLIKNNLKLYPATVDNSGLLGAAALCF